MRKLIFTLCLALAATQLAHAQLDFGVKAGVNYNSNSIRNVSQDVLNGSKSKTGFHAGIFLEANIPIIGLYIRPEFVYTQLSSETVFNTNLAGAQARTTAYEFKKIDIPVLLGKRFLGFGRVFIGPSFQYILEGDFGLEDIKDVEADGFTMGLQLGAGVDIGNLGLDVRWERSFSDTESNFINADLANNNVNFDTRVNQIIVGLSYTF